MAYTFLQLTNKLLSRLNETALSSAQFSGASGFNGQAKDAVNAALNDIYHKYQYWPFMKSTETINVTSSNNEYSISQAYAPIDFMTFQVNKNSAVTPAIVQTALTFMDYHVYKRYRYPLDINASSDQYAQPTWVTRPPTGSTVIFSPWPNTAYTIQYEIWEIPSELSSSSDTMAIPDQFVNVVIDKAQYYAMLFRENLEAAKMIEKKGDDGVDAMLRQIIPGAKDMKDPRIVKPYPLTGPSRFF